MSIFKTVVSALVYAVSIAPLRAEDATLQHLLVQVAPAVVRVTSDMGNGRVSTGTGYLLPNGIIATARHIFADPNEELRTDQVVGLYNVAFGRRTGRISELVLLDVPADDTIFFQIPCVCTTVHLLPIASCSANDEVGLYGYRWGGGPVGVLGHISEINKEGIIRVKTVVKPGLSGGIVFVRQTGGAVGICGMIRGFRKNDPFVGIGATVAHLKTHLQRKKRL